MDDEVYYTIEDVKPIKDLEKLGIDFFVNNLEAVLPIANEVKSRAMASLNLVPCGDHYKKPRTPPEDEEDFHSL